MVEDKKITTVKLEIETKKRIDKLRLHKKESYNEIILRILDILNSCRIAPEKARGKLIRIDKIKKLGTN